MVYNLFRKSNLDSENFESPELVNDDVIDNSGLELDEVEDPLFSPIDKTPIDRKVMTEEDGLEYLNQALNTEAHEAKEKFENILSSFNIDDRDERMVLTEMVIDKLKDKLGQIHAL